MDHGESRPPLASPASPLVSPLKSRLVRRGAATHRGVGPVAPSHEDSALLSGSSTQRMRVAESMYSTSVTSFATFSSMSTSMSTLRGSHNRAARHVSNHTSRCPSRQRSRRSSDTNILDTPPPPTRNGRSYSNLPPLPSTRGVEGSPWQDGSEDAKLALAAAVQARRDAGAQVHTRQVEKRLAALPVVVCRGAENFFLVPTNHNGRDQASYQALMQWWPAGVIRNPEDLDAEAEARDGSSRPPSRFHHNLPPLLSLDEQVHRVHLSKLNKARWRCFFVRIRAAAAGWRPTGGGRGSLGWRISLIEDGKDDLQKLRPLDSPDSIPDLREDLSHLDALADHFPSTVNLRIETPVLEMQGCYQEDDTLDWRDAVIPDPINDQNDPLEPFTPLRARSPNGRISIGLLELPSEGPRAGTYPRLKSRTSLSSNFSFGRNLRGGGSSRSINVGSMDILDSDSSDSDGEGGGGALARQLVPLGGSALGTAGKKRRVREPWHRTGADDYLRACEEEGTVGFSHLLSQLKDGDDMLVLRGFVGELRGTGGVRALAAALEVNNMASTLVLENNGLDARGAELICSALEDNEAITSLTLAKNAIGDKGARAIMPLLDERRAAERGNFVLLKTLDLSECLIRDAGVRLLADAITGEGSITNTVLRVLKLRGNGISDVGAVNIADVLSNSGSIEVLDLGWNRLSARGAKLLLNGLLDNGSSVVASLGLAWNGLGDEVGSSICELLRGNATLKELDLSQTRIGAKACFHIAEGLLGNHSLVSLQLNGNAIGADGGRFLNESIAVNDTLAALGLKGCSFGPPLRALGEQEATPLKPAPSRKGGGDATSPRARRSSTGAGPSPSRGTEKNISRSLSFAVSADDVIDKEDLDNILTQLEEVQLADFERLLLLRMMAGTYLFTAEQAERVIFRGWGVSPSAEKLQAAMLLFTRLVDAHKLESVLCRRMMQREKERVLDELGEYAHFRRENATGHYRIDWSIHMDRLIGGLIMQICRANLRVGCSSSIRNVVINGRDAPETSASGEWADRPPESGTLLLDLVDMRLFVKHGKSPLSDEEFRAFLGKHVGTEGVSTEDKISSLRGSSNRVAITCAQLVEIVENFPWSDERVEVVVIFYGRIVDLEDFYTILLHLGPMEQAAVGMRLGWAQVYDEAHPSGHYIVDARNPADRDVLKRILTLACADSKEGDRQNMHNVHINGHLVTNPLERSGPQLWTWVMEGAKLRPRKDEAQWLAAVGAGAAGGSKAPEDYPHVEFDFFGDDCWDVMECSDVKGRGRESRDAAIELHARRMLILRARCLYPYYEVFVEKAAVPGAMASKGDGLLHKDEGDLNTRGNAAPRASRASGGSDGRAGSRPTSRGNAWGGGLGGLGALGRTSGGLGGGGVGNMVAMMQQKMARARLSAWREKRKQKMRWGRSAFMRSWYEQVRRIVIINAHAGGGIPEAKGTAPKPWNPLRVIFDLMDADGSGSLELIELARGLMKVLGSEAMDAAKQIEQAIGDGDGELDFDEFKTLILERVDASVRVSNGALAKDNIEKEDLLQLLFGANIGADEV